MLPSGQAEANSDAAILFASARRLIVSLFEKDRTLRHSSTSCCIRRWGLAVGLVRHRPLVRMYRALDPKRLLRLQRRRHVGHRSLIECGIGIEELIRNLPRQDRRHRLIRLVRRRVLVRRMDQVVGCSVG